MFHFVVFMDIVMWSIDQVNLPVFGMGGCLCRSALEGIEAQQKVYDLGASQNLHLAHLLAILHVFWRRKFQNDETGIQFCS